MVKIHRKAKRLRENHYFPPEIWAEILPGLPVKPLLKFRCVCRTWCDLIDSSDFVSKHLNLCKSNSDNNRLIVFERSSKWGEKGCVLRRSDTFRKTHQFDFSTAKDGSHFEVEAYINGVFLLHMADPGSQNGRFLALWNPSIRVCVEIPTPPCLIQFNSKVKLEYALGFDPSTQDYKIIVIASYQLPKVHSWIEIYTLSSSSWQVIKLPGFSFACSKEKSFLDGFIHMSGYDLLGAYSPVETHLVSFDVANEVFNAISLPKIENSEELLGRTVTLVDRSIGLFDYGSNRSIVWALEKKNGGNECWSKRYTIDRASDSLFYVARKGLFFVEKKHLLLFESKGEGLKSYDVETKELKLLAKTIAYESIHFVDTYVESLALLGQRERKLCLKTSDD